MFIYDYIDTDEIMFFLYDSHVFIDYFLDKF